MATPPRQALLRVLTGPHAGAELLLSEGPNTVGSDDGCDIVLADPQLQSRHAVLFVSAGAVTVEQTSAGPVYVDGQPVSKTPLRPYQCVTVGETHFAIGPANEAWPTLTPAVLAPLAPAEPPPAEEAVETSPAPPPPESPVSAPRPPAAPRRDRRRGTFAVIVAAIVLLAFLLLWNPFGGTPVVATQNNRAELEQQVESILKQFTVGSDLAVDRQAKALTVTGYVPTASVRKELATALEKVAAPVRVSVTETAALAEATARVLKMHQLDLKTNAGGPGEVVISGVATSPAAWTKVKSRVTADIPKIRTLTDRTTGPNQPRPVTVATIPTPPPPQALITPESSPTAAAPKPAAEAPAETPPTAVSMAIRSITIGQSRAIVLESGERIFEGATLPGGYVVKSIAADRIVLERMGEESIVSVGGSK